MSRRSPTLEEAARLLVVYLRDEAKRNFRARKRSIKLAQEAANMAERIDWELVLPLKGLIMDLYERERENLVASNGCERCGSKNLFDIRKDTGHTAERKPLPVPPNPSHPWLITCLECGTQHAHGGEYAYSRALGWLQGMQAREENTND